MPSFAVVTQNVITRRVRRFHPIQANSLAMAQKNIADRLLQSDPDGYIPGITAITDKKICTVTYPFHTIFIYDQETMTAEEAHLQDVLQIEPSH